MAEARHTKEDLKMMQALPLDLKVRLTEDRIRAWVHEFGEDGVCVSFSGGKDSTVLLHIVRNLYPNVKAVFSNTGLEYPEIQRFVRGFDNTDIIVPEINFREVITQLGYPLISKEVAEAIHYARKLREGGWNGTGNAENCKAQESGSPGQQTVWKRTELRGGGHAYPDRESGEQTDGLTRADARKKWGGVVQEVPQPGLQRSNRPRELLEEAGRTHTDNYSKGSTGQRRDAGEERNSREKSSTDQGAAEPG